LRCSLPFGLAETTCETLRKFCRWIYNISAV
jgi:hypothetical protein